MTSEKDKIPFDLGPYGAFENDLVFRGGDSLRVSAPAPIDEEDERHVSLHCLLGGEGSSLSGYSDPSLPNTLS